MFYKKRQEYNREVKSSSPLGICAGSGTCCYRGVECRYTVYKLSENSNGVRVRASYKKSDVPWEDRSKYESDVKYEIMRDLNARGYTMYGFEVTGL